MNCSVCGGPLLFSRVAFHCSCGAYVHAYCLDKHILLAHRPEFEEGTVDLNGDFHPISERAEAAAAAQAESEEEAAIEEQAGAGTGMSEAIDQEEESVDEDEEDEAAAAGTGEPSSEESGFVEVDTVAEEEKLESGDIENNEEE